MTKSMTRRKPTASPSMLRDLVFRNLRSSECVLVWNKDDSFARDFENRLVSAQPYLLEPPAVRVLQDLLMKLGPQDFYAAIASMRLPYEEVWLEAPFPTDNGGEIRCGMLISEGEEGLRCLTSAAYWFDDQKIWYPMHAGTAVTFTPDGQVVYEDTPVANFYDSMAAARTADRDEEGRFKAPLSSLVDEGMVSERHAKDLGAAIRMAGLMAAFCGLMGKREVIEVDPLRAPSRQQQRIHARDDLPVPVFGVSRVALSRLGRLQQRAEADEDAQRSDGEEGSAGSRRAAHWVRGHLFLARNGKLVWRRPHVRGTGDAQRRVVLVGADEPGA